LGLRSEVLRNDSITNRIDKAAQETSERQASLAKEYADKFQSLAVQVEHCKTVCDECKADGVAVTKKSLNLRRNYGELYNAYISSKHRDIGCSSLDKCIGWSKY
jgi:hypothetical protein